MELDIATMINQYGFPIIAVFGLGYFIYYIWQWVTESVDPIISESLLWSKIAFIKTKYHLFN